MFCDYVHSIRFDLAAVYTYTIRYITTYIKGKKKFAKLGEKSDFIKKKTEQGITRKKEKKRK